MARPVGMPMQLLQELADRPVMGDGIRHGGDSLEPEDAAVVAADDAAAVGAVAAGILHVVVTGGVGLPDIDLDALDGVTVGVAQGADDEQRLALGVVRHGLAVGHFLGVVGVEGAEHGALGAAGGLGVVDAVDEDGETEDVGEEDEFLGRRYSVRISCGCIGGSWGACEPGARRSKSGPPPSGT